MAGLAFAIVGAFGSATPTFATTAAWPNGGAHDQTVVCSFKSHTVGIAFGVAAMDGYLNGQLVATRMLWRDVTANGAWVSTPWQYTLVKSWAYVATPIEGGGYWTNKGVVLTGPFFSAYRDHVYSVYGDYYYADSAGVFRWEDMHATYPYIISTAGGSVQASTCQAGF